MGAEGPKILAAYKLVPKGRSINSLRHKLYELPNGAKAIVSYSASIVDVDYAKAVDLMTDTAIACRYERTGKLEPEIGDYRYVNDYSDLIEYIHEEYRKTGKRVKVTLDTETKGLDPYHPLAYIITLQATYKPGQADVVYFKSRGACRKLSWLLRSQIYFLLTSEKVAIYGANFKYDLNWFAKLWGFKECTTLRFDTMLVGSLLEENRSNSLNTHAKVYTSMGGYDDSFNDKYNKGAMDKVPLDDLLTYAGGDTDACYQVATEQRKELANHPGLFNFYTKILHPAARAYEKVEQVGWYVDQEAYAELDTELRGLIVDYEKEALDHINIRHYYRHRDKDGKINLLKAEFLKDVLFSPAGFNLKPIMKTEKKGDPSTAGEHLAMFAEHETAGPFIELLKRYQEVTKTHSTYVVGFLKHLRSDGRFHPTYYLFSGRDYEEDDQGGAVTGRLSVKDPAIQTVPKHTLWAKKIRRCIIPPRGYVIGSNDYSQGELKIAACLANEERMIESYRKGLDLHAVTAARLSGYEFGEFLALQETDLGLYESIRQRGKAGNFGLLYGMSAEGFQSYAWKVYGVRLSLEEAEAAREAFFVLYPKLVTWHATYKNFAANKGYVISPLGRIRHLPMIHSADRFFSNKAGRQAINSPVQGTLSDMALWATGIMWRRGLHNIVPTWGMVHDQLLFFLPEDRPEHWAKVTKDIMENLPFQEVGWKPQLQFTVDCQIGPNLADLSKIKV